MAEMKSLIILERVGNLIQKVPNWEKWVIYETCAAIQRDLDRLGKWDDCNLMKLHTLQLRRNNRIHQFTATFTAGVQLCRQRPCGLGGQ